MPSDLVQLGFLIAAGIKSFRLDQSAVRYLNHGKFGEKNLQGRSIAIVHSTHVDTNAFDSESRIRGPWIGALAGPEVKPVSNNRAIVEHILDELERLLG